jgi:hypothetical protein
LHLIIANNLTLVLGVLKVVRFNVLPKLLDHLGPG